jgi:hypothetical protein
MTRIEDLPIPDNKLNRCFYTWRFKKYFEIEDKEISRDEPYDWGFWGRELIRVDLAIHDLYKKSRMKEKIAKLFNWYLKNKAKLEFCSNPSCDHLIHTKTVFGQIIRFDMIKPFLSIIKNKIKPIFLCCTCHAKNLHETLGVFECDNE